MKTVSPIACSVIIPTYNTCELTLACLSQIRNYPPPDPYEVIVVDNNSTDGTSDRVRQRFPEFVAIRNAGNLGFARACNQGARVAHGKYLLFLNSDTEPMEKTFGALLDWMESHPKTGIVGPELVGPGGTLLQMSWSWHPLLVGEVIHRFFAPNNIGPSRIKRKLIRYLQRKPRTVPFICGACLMIRREVFESLGGFDESFELYFEDTDLCWRCAKAGWKVDFIPQSKIIHHIGQSTKGPWSMSSLIYQQSHLTYYRKHAPRWNLHMLKLYLLFKWPRIWLSSLLESQDRGKAQTYSRSFPRVILESERFMIDTPLAASSRTGMQVYAPATNGAHKLHLGCGYEIRSGWVNLDLARLPGVDVVHDIENIPWPFESESFDRISAHQLLEHVEYIPVLREALRVLRKGGIFEIVVPHFTSRNNWIDPTHKKTFSIRTFEFFVKDSRFHRDYYFDFAFSRLRKQRLVFEKSWLVYNYLVELLVNLHPKMAVLYEATFMRNLFPAESVFVELEK